jgi:hypothetical protein
LEHLNLQTLYFEKTTDGWLWLPQPDAETKAQFRDWSHQQEQHWKIHWPQKLLGNSVKIQGIEADSAPTEEAARQVFAAWHEALRSGDTLTSLQQTARLTGAKSDATLLRNLGYELSATRRQSQPPAAIAAFRGRFVTAVGAQTIQEESPSFPLYPVVMTPDGPRILLEIDLFATATRSREFLNRHALDRLREFSPAVADEMESHLERYVNETTERESD